MLVAGGSFRVPLWPPHIRSSRRRCGFFGPYPPGRSSANALSRSAACESGSAALRRARRTLVRSPRAEPWPRRSRTSSVCSGASPRATKSSSSSLTTVVFSVAPCQSPNTCFFPLLSMPSATTQHLFAEMNPVNQDRHQIEFLQSFLVQFFQLCRAGLHELAAHAGFLDPIAIEHALHRPPIVPRAQPGHDPFPHRPLPSPVVLHSSTH